MTTNNKDFKVKNGLLVTNGGSFGGSVVVGTPTQDNHAATKEYVDDTLVSTGGIPYSEKGVANGVATLNGLVVVPDEQISSDIARMSQVSASYNYVYQQLENVNETLTLSVYDAISSSNFYTDESVTALANTIDIEQINNNIIDGIATSASYTDGSIAIYSNLVNDEFFATNALISSVSQDLLNVSASLSLSIEESQTSSACYAYQLIYAEAEARNTQVLGAINTAAQDSLDKVNAHNVLTENVHGIVNTAHLVTLDGTQTLTNKTIQSPLGITKSDVGLGDVDNTSDLNKPVSTAQQSALDLKANLNGPTFSNTVTVDSFEVNDYIHLTPSASANYPTWQEGNFYYSDDEKTFIGQGSGTNFEMSLGQREWVRCRNSTLTTIPKGTPVYINGVHISADPVYGHCPTIDTGDATNETKTNIIGLTGESINSNSFGYVVVRGYLKGIDTSALISGGRFHLGFESPGQIIADAPDYPNFPADLGICLTSDDIDGSVYVHIVDHAFERIRVTNGAYIDGDLTVGGDFTLIGSQSEVQLTNLTVSNNFIYLNSGDTIGASGTTFSGTGVDDATLVGHYDGTTTKTFKVKITINGSGSNPDSFRWSVDDFVTNNGSDILIEPGVEYALSDGIKVSFIADNGHIVNDIWSGTASPVNLDIAFIGNRNTGNTGIGYTHLGMFFDVSDDKFKFFKEYGPEPTGTINTADASFTLGTVMASSFEGSGNNITDINANNITTGTISETTIPSSIARTSSPSFTTPTLGAANATSITFSDGTQSLQGVPSLTPIIQKTGSYTLSALTERDDLIEMGSSSPTTLTIPLNSAVAFPIGTSLDILQTGTGQVTIAGEVGVTVNATPGLKLRTQWSSATIFKRAENTWVVYGDLTN